MSGWEVIDHWMAGARMAFLFGMSGAFFALGVATVCKWLKWAPINITVNVTQRDPDE